MEPFAMQYVWANNNRALEPMSDNRMKDGDSRTTSSESFAGPYGEIPKRLKEYYDSLREEAIPDRFLDLLEKLDRAEQEAAKAVPSQESS